MRFSVRKKESFVFAKHDIEYNLTENTTLRILEEKQEDKTYLSGYASVAIIVFV